MARLVFASQLIVLATISLYLASPLRAISSASDFSQAERAHWAFQKVVRPEVPKLREKWVRNPIDALVLSALKAKHIEPGPPADKVTLIRRATLDLIGLPPTPEEVDAFLADKSSAAF